MVYHFCPQLAFFCHFSPVLAERPRPHRPNQLAAPISELWYPPPAENWGFGTPDSAKNCALVPGPRRNPRSAIRARGISGTKPRKLPRGGYQTSQLGARRYQTPRSCHPQTALGIPNLSTWLNQAPSLPTRLSQDNSAVKCNNHYSAEKRRNGIIARAIAEPQSPIFSSHGIARLSLGRI